MAVIFVRGDVVDDDEFAVLPDFIAESRAEFQFTAWQETKGDFVAHCAGDPLGFSHPGHCGEAQACGAADDFKNFLNRVDAGN